LTTKSWLPVPHRPDTDQVSLISTSPGGSTIIRIGGWRPSSTMQWAMNQWLCWQPLANDHCPLTRNPPSVGVARPVGLTVPARMTSGPSAYRASKVFRGSLASSTGASPPIITVHPTEPSARASSSITRISSGRASSAPPWLCGTSIRKQPVAVSCSTRSGGTRRPRSISSARAATAGASAATTSRVPFISLT
jgi:hypothetical protein